jgi:PilZ domain
LCRKSIREYNHEQRAGVVQWQYRSFPSFGHGFDSRRPLQQSHVEPRPMTFECDRCKSQETIEHSDPEDDVYAFSANVVRYCNECKSSTVWKKCSGPRKESAPLAREALFGAPANRGATENRRKHHRAKAKFRACIRRPGFEDDIVVCEDASRGGVRFKSRRTYFADTPIEIAVPYSPGSSSIFSPAQILYVQELDQQKFRCGVAYTRQPTSGSSRLFSTNAP